MSRTAHDALHTKPSPDYKTIAWDSLLVLGGVALVAVTFHTYRYFSPIHTTDQSAPNALLSDAKADFSGDPDDLDAWTQRAISEYQKGPDHYIEAMNALNRARKLGATDESLFYYAGVMYDALNLPDYAIDELQKFLRHNPDDYDASVRLANLYFKESKTAEAEALYRRALRHWPKDPTVWFNYAVVSKDLNHADEAVRALEQVKKLTSGQLPIGGYFVEGEIDRLKGDDDAAITAYQHETSLHNTYLPAFEALEQALKRKGRTAETKTVRKQINELKRAQAAQAANHG